MAKKTKKSDIDALIKLTAYNTEPVVITTEDGDITIDINDYIDADRKMAIFVNVAKMIWTDDGRYNPGLYTFAYKCALLYRFTNINISDSDRLFKLVECSGLIDCIEKAIPARLLDDFKEDFDKSMDYYSRYSIESSKLSFVSKLSSMIDGVEDLFSKLSNIEESDIVDSLVKLAGENKDSEVS